MGILSETLNIGGIQFPGLAAVVHAYKKDKDVNILSTPQILTTDNEEAAIMVGKNVPYQTKSGSTGTFESFNTYEYRDVGITLKITPQISRDRLVRLNIAQEVTKLDETGQFCQVEYQRSADHTEANHYHNRSGSGQQYGGDRRVDR